jgi:hypothetical protein
LRVDEHAGQKVDKVDVVFMFEYETDVEPGDQLCHIR